MVSNDVVDVSWNCRDIRRILGYHNFFCINRRGIQFPQLLYAVSTNYLSQNGISITSLRWKANVFPNHTKFESWPLNKNSIFFAHNQEGKSRRILVLLTKGSLYINGKVVLLMCAKNEVKRFCHVWVMDIWLKGV